MHFDVCDNQDQHVKVIVANVESNRIYAIDILYVNQFLVIAYDFLGRLPTHVVDPIFAFEQKFQLLKSNILK